MPNSVYRFIFGDKIFSNFVFLCFVTKIGFMPHLTWVIHENIFCERNFRAFSHKNIQLSK